MSKDLAFDIARQMAREVARIFPTATAADFERACLILQEQIDMLFEATEVTTLPHLSSDTLFPKPDKASS